MLQNPDINLSVPNLSFGGRYGGDFADKTSATTTLPAMNMGEKSAIGEAIAATRLSLGQATDLAFKLMAELDQFLARWEIAGSIRRKEPTIGDIDVVLIPNNMSGLKAKVLSIDPTAHGGDVKIFFEYGGRKVNLFFTNDDAWGATLLEATGSSSYIIGLRMKVKKRGWKLNNTGLYDQSGNKIAGKTEEEIFDKIWEPDPNCSACGGVGGGGKENKCPLCRGKLAGKRYKTPENRN
jgi:hypothetical protein